MKIASVVVNRNDGYKDFERGLIHFKSMIRAFDEVNYVDWNSPNGSFIWEIEDKLPKKGKIKHYCIPSNVVSQIIFDANAQKCNESLSRNIAIRRSDADWIVSTNLDVIPPTKQELKRLIKKLDKNTFYTISRREAPKDIIYNSKTENRLRENLANIPARHFPAKVTPNDNYSLIKNSMDLSLYWALRSKKAFGSNPHKALFGIVQGGLFKDLRIKSLNGLIEIGFDGYAMGGLAVGESQKEMFTVLDDIKEFLPPDKPHYLMGVGTPSDILGAVKRGIDMFDCVLPTRSGRTGLAFTWDGKINIKNKKYQNDNTPLDINCTNLDLNKYSKNYLNHLFNTNEILASMILTLHNINFYQELMSSIRNNINQGTFSEFHDKYIDKL